MASRKTLVKSELLLLEHRRRQPGALEELVELWERPLFYYIRRLVTSEDEAKDVAQDVWLTVIRKVGTVRDPAAFPAWLYKVARTRAASHFRKTFDFEPMRESDSAAAIALNSNDSLPAMAAEELHWGLKQLSPPHSECLILHFLEGFSLGEVSAITGASLGTVKSRIHYAKKALGDVLKKGEHGHE
jgi:RNA polymerase sigma-70 factor (ECF subfamily)